METELREANGSAILTKNGYPSLVVSLPGKIEHSMEAAPNNLHRIGRAFANNDIDKDYVRIMTASPTIKVASVSHNEKEIKKSIDLAAENGADILLLPELCLTGYTIGDLVLDSSVMARCLKAIGEIVEYTRGKDIFVSFGSPFELDGVLYNVAINAVDGEIVGIVPKTHIPSYREFYEGRYFHSGPKTAEAVIMGNKVVPFGSSIVYVNRSNPLMRIGVEICEDLWVIDPPSTALVKNGATIILNLSASNETVGKRKYRSDLVRMTSALNFRLRLRKCRRRGKHDRFGLFRSSNHLRKWRNPFRIQAVFWQSLHNRH